MTYIKRTLSRRKFGQHVSAVSLVAAFGAGCAAKDLPPGLFEQSEIKNPKNPKRYSKSYAPPKNQFKTHSVSHAGHKRTIFTYVPKKKQASSLLLLLHGSLRTGASMIDKWRQLSDQYGIVLVAPNSSSERSWSFENDGFDFMQNIISYVTETAGLPALPIYGFGHSAGAVMMTHLSVRHGAYFTAVGAHAGNPRQRDLEEYRSYKKPRAPLIHILGDNDHIFKIENARLAGRELVAQGQDVNLMIIKNHNHWYYDIGPFVNKTAWLSMTS